MTSKEFEVGGVVYFMHLKTGRVMPARVVEKIMRTSLEGSRATYVLSLKQKDSSRQIEVDPDTFEMFQTPDEIRAYMISKATEAISLLISQAVESAKSLLEDGYKNEEHSDFNENQDDEYGNITEVELESGLKARVMGLKQLKY